MSCARVEADIGCHAGEEDVLGASEAIAEGDGLALQVADRAHPLAPEQLEAADVDSGEDDERVSGVHAGDQGPEKFRAMSTSPATTALMGTVLSDLTSCTSVNPSAGRNSFARK